MNTIDIFNAHNALIAHADKLTRENTAFGNFEALLDAKGSYRPTLRRNVPAMRVLANLYDAAQQARGDDRRAFMAGVPTREGSIIDPVLFNKEQNWYVHGDTRTFWDRYTKHWISYTVDSDGNQIGECDMYPNADSLLRTVYG